MTEKCEVCGKEEERLTVEYVNCSYSPELRLRVCGDCMNLLGNREWDKLEKLTEMAQKKKVSE